MSPGGAWGKGSGKQPPVQSRLQMAEKELADLKWKVLKDAQDDWSGQASGEDASWDGWQVKGKGKGKGKSSGKGKGAQEKGKGKGKQGWWPCPVAQCKDVLNHGEAYLNHPGRDACNLCWNPRAAVAVVEMVSRNDQLAAVRAEVAAAAAPEVPLSKTAAKKLRNAERKKEHEAAGEQSACVEVMDDDEEEEEQATPLPTEQQVQAALKLLTLPQPLKEGWTAAKTVDAGTTEEVTTGLLALQAERDSCSKVVALVEAGAAVAGVDVTVTKAKITALDKAITKMSKDVPTPAVSAAQLTLDLELYRRTRGEKLVFVKKGAENAKANFQSAWEMHRAIASHWSTRLEKLESEEIVRQERFEERNDTHEERHRQIVAEYQSRIAAAEQQAGAVKPKAPEAATPPPTAADADRLEAVKAFEALDLTAPVDQSDLPDLSGLVPVAEALLPMTNMFAWARASTLGDAYLPFSFAQMGATIDMAQSLSGVKVWKAFFKGRAAKATDVCPMQLRQIIFVQLMSHDASMKKITAEQHAQVQKDLEESQPALKKMKVLLRSSPYA